MSKSLLAAVHNAVAGAADDGHQPETGATAPHTKGSSMSDDTKPAGGNQSGISKADHDAAITAARTEGVTAGEKAATDRLNAALGADGVKGDAGRMAAALDLAVKSPAMSGADVAGFVVANVAAAKPGAAAAADYSANRVAAAGLAQPQGEADKSNKTALAAAVATTNKRR